MDVEEQADAMNDVKGDQSRKSDKEKSIPRKSAKGKDKPKKGVDKNQVDKTSRKEKVNKAQKKALDYVESVKDRMPLLEGTELVAGDINEDI